MTLRQVKRIGRSYGIYVKKSKSKWGGVYQVGFIGGRKQDSVHVNTIADVLDVITHAVRKVS